jgi:hypothetical protein
MKKELYYLYLCDNGTLLTPAFMENVPHKKQYRLYAEEGYVLTKDNENFVNQTFTSEAELPLWKEVKQ